MLCVQHIDERFRKNHIRKNKSSGEQRRYLFIPESCYAATDTGHKEGEFRMSLCIYDEVIYVWAYHIDTSMHGRDCIALSLHSNALSPYGSEISYSCGCSTAAMAALKIASENKHLVGSQ